MTPSADRVVIVVFDGLRPDMIAGRMPRLEAFAAEAVRFTEARSVFPSVTRVATTSIATGCWPGQHGIINNAFHQPHLVQGRVLDTSDFAQLSALDAASGGAIVSVPSLGERLAAAGKQMVAVHCGSPGSAFLINHRAARNGHWTLTATGAAGTQTPDIVDRAAVLGPLPKQEMPRFQAVDYAVRGFETLAMEDRADLTVVWFPEPDSSYHFCGIGSDETREVMAAVDGAFGRILDAIRAAPDGHRTAVVAMSDHGQLSTMDLFDLGMALSADGLKADHRPGQDTQMALTLGRMGECRMLSRDPSLPGAVAEWLMGREEVAMVFARDDLAAGLSGTLPLSAVQLAHPRTAELTYVLAASDASDPYGLPGTALMSGGVPVGGGMHGGLHRRELNTVLMVSAPEARQGVAEDMPCGLVDIAPTVASLLGLPWDGMAGAPLPLSEPPADRPETSVLTAECGGFRQTLTIREIGGRRYLHEGGRA